MFSKLILLFLLLTSSTLWAANDIALLNDNHQDLDIARSAQYLIDESGRLSIQDIASENYSKRFLPINSDFLQLGLVKGNVWVRINIAIRTTKNVPSLLDINAPRLEYLDLYLPTMFGDQVQALLGEARPYSNRLIEHPDYFYPLPTNAPPVFTVYLKLSSHLPINVQLHLKTLSKATVDSQKDFSFTGILLGFLAILFISNVFFYIKSTHPMYIAYSALLICIALFHLSLHGQLYQFFPNKIGIQERIYNFTALAGTAAIVLFSKLYLDTRSHFPKVDKYLIALTCINLFFATIYSAYPNSLSISYLSLLSFTSISVLTVLAIYAFATDTPFSGYYLIARITLLLGYAAWFLSAYGIISSAIIYEWGLTVAIVLEAMIYFIGMIAQLSPLLKRHASVVNHSQNDLYEMIADISSRLRRQVNIIDNGLKHVQKTPNRNISKNFIFNGQTASNNLKNLLVRLDNIYYARDKNTFSQQESSPLFLSKLIDNAYNHFQQLDQDNAIVEITSDNTNHLEILHNAEVIEHLIETILQECKHFTDQTLTVDISRRDPSHEGNTILEINCFPLPTHLTLNNNLFDMGMNYIHILVNSLNGSCVTSEENGFHRLTIELPITWQIRHTNLNTLDNDTYSIIVFGEHSNDLNQALGILHSNLNAIEHFSDLDDLLDYLDKPDQRKTISIILAFDHEGQIPHIIHKKIRPLMKLEDQCLLISDNVKMSREYAKTIGFDDLLPVSNLDSHLETQLSRLIRKGERLRDASLSRVKRS